MYLRNNLVVSTVILGLLSAPISLKAVSGVWTNPGGGSWNNSANWSGGIVADGTDGTANFNTLNITAGTTVTLDGSRTIGSLLFGDTDSTTNYIFTPGSGGTLTLAVSGGSPVISNATNTLLDMSVPLAGTSGFWRKGGGSLGANQVLLRAASPGLSGTVVMGDGSSSLTAFADPLAFGTGKIVLGLNPGDSQLNFTASGGDITLTNDVEVRASRIVVNNTTVSGLAAGNQTWNGNVILNHGNISAHDFFAQKTLTINGTISEATSGLQFVLVSGTATLTGTNTYTGGTAVNGGSLYLANPSGNALPAGIVSMQGPGRIYLSANNQIADSCVLRFNNTATNNGRLELTGFNETIAGIDDQASTGNRIVEAASDGVTGKPATLTLNVPAGTNYTHASYIRNGTGAGSILSLVKTGAGTQTFSGSPGQVSYAGLTTINAGVLEVSGANSVLANSPVNLAGGTLLISGSSGTGLRAQSITNDLTVAGTLHKTGGMALQLGSATANIFTGTTLVDGGTLQLQAGGILASNAAVVNGGTLEILGEFDATSVTVNPGGTLTSGNVSTFTSLITGGITNAGGVIRGWANLANVTMQSGTINPAIGTTTATLTISNLTCQGGTLQFNLDAVNTTTGGGVNDLLAVDTLVLSGPTTIDLPNAGALTGNRYVIVTYNASAGSFSNLHLSPAIAGLRSQPSIDTGTPGEIAIVFANPGAVGTTLTWAGGLNGNAWDVGITTNWLDLGSNPNAFFTSDAVTFDDSSANNTVALAGTVYPGLIKFNNSARDYTVSGAGTMVSSVGLSQTGTGRVTLAVPYQGGAVTNSGGGYLALTNASFSGAFEVDAGATVVMTGSNYFNGAFAMDQLDTMGGTLILTNGGYLLAQATGGSWGLLVDNNLLVVAGPGSTLNTPSAGGYQIGNSGSSTGNRVILQDGGAWTNIANNVALPGGGATSGYNNELILTNGGRFVWSPTGTGSFLIGQPSGAYSNQVQILGASSVLDMGGHNFYSGRNGNYNLTTVDAGVLTNCVNILVNDNGAGQGNGLLVRNGGSVTVSSAVNLGGNAGSVGAFVTVDNASLTAGSANIGQNAAATGSSLTITNNGNMRLSGTLTVSNTSSTVGFTSGTLSLGGANVSNGLPFTVGDGIHTASLNFNGGSFRFANNLAVSANATLAGAGTVGIGNVTVNGTLIPGDAFGSLTVSNGLTLSGSTIMKVNKAGNTNNSVTVIGALAYGGTLTVTNLGTAPLVAGDQFTLFQFGSQSGAFSDAPVVISAANSSVTASFDPATGVLTINSAASGLASNPTNISYSVSGNNLNLIWPGDHLGWFMQSNSVNLTDPNSWFDVPGSNLGTNLNITISPAQPNVFYRLRYPN